MHTEHGAGNYARLLGDKFEAPDRIVDAKQAIRVARVDRLDALVDRLGGRMAGYIRD